MHKYKNIRKFALQKMTKPIVHILYVFCLLLNIILISCTTATNKEDRSEGDPTLIEGVLTKQVNVQNFFNTIPSAIDVFQIISKTKLNYNPDYLNDPTKYKEYSLEKSRVLNLGIYGADLAISGAFSQTQESMLFLKCTNHLAQELGISSAFDEKIMDRLESNKENRDSTLEIISQAFKKADKIFIDNKRGELSVFMIAGAYIEAMYVAGEYALSKSNDTLAMKKIIELYAKQDEPLSYLINLLEDNSINHEDLDIKTKLKNIQPYLKESYNNINVFKQTHELFTQLRNQIIHVY